MIYYNIVYKKDTAVEAILVFPPLSMQCALELTAMIRKVNNNFETNYESLN